MSSIKIEDHDVLWDDHGDSLKRSIISDSPYMDILYDSCDRRINQATNSVRLMELCLL
jgi:hypothetical protein